MQKPLRRKLFYALAAVFVLAAPFLITYSLGYTLDIFRARVGKTGGIFVKSSTPGISLFLNRRLVKETPFFSGGAILIGIEPETYLLRVEKDGYRPWSKAVEVQPEMVTELRNVLMVPLKLPAATSTAELSRITTTSTPSSFRLDPQKNLIRVENDKEVKVIASGVVAFHEFPGEALFVDKNGFLARFDPQTQAIVTLGRPGFYLSLEPWQWIKSADGKVVVIDPSRGLFLLETLGEIKPLDGGVKNAAFDSQGGKLLIQKEKSLEVLWLTENIYQPFQKQRTRELILRLEEPLLDAGWFYGDDSHLVLHTGGGIFLTELEGRGGRQTTELVSGPVDEMLTSPNIPRALFFRTGKIWKKIEL